MWRSTGAPVLRWEWEKVATIEACTLVPAGASPSACGGRGWRVGREAVMAALPFTHHSTMAPHFYGSLGSSRNIPVVEFLTPNPSVCLHTANNSFLPVSTLQTPHSITQPTSALVDTHLRLG